MGIVNRILTLFRDFNWVIIPAAFFSVVFHEISHGYTAFLMGDKTAKYSGRLSLNPLKHFDTVGMICMVLFGFGWAKPVPVNPSFFKHRKLGMILVALSGPLSNILMAIVALFITHFIIAFEIQNSILAFLLYVLVEFLICFAFLNIGLAAFNLLPIPPLDGSKILFSVLPSKINNIILKYEHFGMLILIVLINLPFFNRFLFQIRSGLFYAIQSLITLILG